MKTVNVALCSAAVVCTVLFFAILPGVSPAATAEPRKQQSSPANRSPTPVQERFQIKEKPLRMLSPAAGAQPGIAGQVRKLDLVCSVRAYYDESLTKPVSGGTAHYALMAYNTKLHFNAEVKNAGLANKSGPFLARMTMDYPNYPTNASATATWNVVVADLGPGVSGAKAVWIGPLFPPPYFIAKQITVSAEVDLTKKVAEDIETNNTCSLTVTLAP